MREIVFIGEMEPVTRALGLARGRVHDLAGALGVETRLENAMDPFFDPNSTRAVTQKMFPTKQEMVYGDDLAISSSNFHRNFFGQRFNISSVDGQTAYTACIGMGLERWIRDAGGLRQRYRAGHCPSRGAGRRACLGVRSRRGPGLNRDRQDRHVPPSPPARPRPVRSQAPLRRTAPLPPETANLLDQGVIAALTNALRELAGQAGLRAIVLSAEGDTFCAGIDLRWMQAGAHASPADNLRSAATLARLFKAIHDSPVPTIAKIQGDALSAGLGLVAACDIAIANDHARFRTREVRVGILPALMSPYGAGARTQAGEIPVPDGQAPVGPGSVAGGPAAPDLPERRAGRPGGQLRGRHRPGQPGLAAGDKALVQTVAHRAVTDQVVAETTACIADFRARGQAQAGIACAIDGVLPPWMEDHESSR